MKNAICDIKKNAPEGIANKQDEADEQTSEVEDNTEIKTQGEKQRNKRLKYIWR